MSGPRWILAVAVVLLSPEATASVGSARALQLARLQYAAQEYRSVVSTLRAVPDDPTATGPQRIDALELLGLAQLILGQRQQAREAFVRLLRLAPDHELRDPSGSPKLRQFFEAIRASLPPPSAPVSSALRLRHHAPKRARAGRKATFSVRVLRGRPPRSLVLRWRVSNQRAFRWQAMTLEEGLFWASIDLPKASRSYDLDYYFAVDGAPAELDSMGSHDDPLRLVVKGAQAKAFYRSWWFWTLVGAVVVGGSVAAVVGASEPAPTGNLPPGKLQLQ